MLNVKWEAKIGYVDFCKVKIKFDRVGVWKICSAKLYLMLHLYGKGNIAARCKVQGQLFVQWNNFVIHVKEDITLLWVPLKKKRKKEKFFGFLPLGLTKYRFVQKNQRNLQPNKYQSNKILVKKDLIKKYFCPKPVVPKSVCPKECWTKQILVEKKCW